MIWQRGAYQLTDEKRRLDLDAVHALLSTTYWAGDRPRHTTARAIRHSLCLGLFHRGKQVGFCRAVTDFCTFAWVCDMVIAPAHRRRGLGKWMMECLLDHARLQVRSQVLATRDAHTLYERYGFRRTEYLRRKPAETGPASAAATRADRPRQPNR